MARVLIVNQNVFFQVIQGLQSPQAFEQLLDVWISKMSSVTHSDKRKLLGLALASLLTVQNELIYDRFTPIMTNLCEVLNDIMRDDNGTMYE